MPKFPSLPFDLVGRVWQINRRRMMIGADGSLGGKPIIDNAAGKVRDLPFCPDCGKEVLPGDMFCLNCGRNLLRTGTQPTPQPVAHGAQPFALPPSGGPPAKSPVVALLLNLFLPGFGYIYNGAGRDAGQLIFGVLVFLFYFVGLVGTFVAELLSPPPVQPSGVSPLDALSLLLFLLPIAFAYDGHHRASFA
jgi:zinc ribbon protein